MTSPGTGAPTSATTVGLTGTPTAATYGYSCDLRYRNSSSRTGVPVELHPGWWDGVPKLKTAPADDPLSPADSEGGDL